VLVERKTALLRESRLFLCDGGASRGNTRRRAQLQGLGLAQGGSDGEKRRAPRGSELRTEKMEMNVGETHGEVWARINTGKSGRNSKDEAEAALLRGHCEDTQCEVVWEHQTAETAVALALRRKFRVPHPEPATCPVDREGDGKIVMEELESGLLAGRRVVLRGKRVRVKQGGDPGCATRGIFATGRCCAVPKLVGGGGSDTADAGGRQADDPRDPHGHIAHEFNMLDLNKDGVLSVDELFHGLCGRGWEQDDIQGLFERLDTNGDGVVSLEEYLEGMYKIKHRSEEGAKAGDDQTAQAGGGTPPLQRDESGDSPASDTARGGHATHAPAQAAAIRVVETPDSASPEQIAMLRRLGLNRVQVMRALKNDMIGSIDLRAPMRVIKYLTFKEHGRIPRSDDKVTKKLSEVPDDAMLGFISHRWFRPWHTKEECEANGHVWWGKAHPDDAQGTKHRLICDGMEKLAKAKGWDIDNVYLWVDFAGVEQDDEELLKAGVASLRGYITLCDAVLIPASAVPEGAEHTVDMVPGGYGDRGWTRLEAMSMYAVSALKQVEAPEIWVAAGDGACFLERFDYVLKELPSAGVLFSEADREYIRGHETAFVEQMKEAVKRNGYIAKHTQTVNCVAFDPKDKDGDLVASGGDDGVIKLVNQRTGTAVWTVETKEKLRSLAFSRDGGILAAGGSDGRVRVWTVAAGSKPVEVGTLTGTIASWQDVDPKTKELAAQVKEGRSSAGSNRTGQYIVTANGDMVYVYKTDADGKKQGEPMACFRSPASVSTVSCKGTSVVAGCSDGQVLFLEAPLLTAG